MDLCKAAERVLNAYCVETGFPECNMFVNVAWNEESDDALSPKAVVGDNFVDGDTLVVNADMVKRHDADSGPWRRDP